MSKFDDIQDGLDNMILSEMSYANECDKASDEHRRAIGNFNTLYTSRLETQKVADARDDAYQKRCEEIERRKAENALREAESSMRHKEATRKLVADIATNGVKVATYVIVGKWAAGLEGVGFLSSGTAKNLVRGVQKFVDFNKY